MVPPNKTTFSSDFWSIVWLFQLSSSFLTLFWITFDHLDVQHSWNLLRSPKRVVSHRPALFCYRHVFVSLGKSLISSKVNPMCGKYAKWIYLLRQDRHYQRFTPLLSTRLKTLSDWGHALPVQVMRWDIFYSDWVMILTVSGILGSM